MNDGAIRKSCKLVSNGPVVDFWASTYRVLDWFQSTRNETQWHILHGMAWHRMAWHRVESINQSIHRAKGTVWLINSNDSSKTKLGKTMNNAIPSFIENIIK
mmetsp:Transcript_20216/g.47345  ORF Transcript_20216/g.47345 Transcript_20216/m.47345 type:complete len:102 (-) Transcript_20216:505-810(-)